MQFLLTLGQKEHGSISMTTCAVNSVCVRPLLPCFCPFTLTFLSFIQESCFDLDPQVSGILQECFTDLDFHLVFFISEKTYQWVYFLSSQIRPFHFTLFIQFYTFALPISEEAKSNNV